MPDHKLDGVHHFTGVTADVTTNVDFWCRILGLRFVKKTLNFETTFRYHPYFGDEKGTPGSVVTFLEFNELERGIAGAGNIHRIVLRVGSYEAVEFWLRRLATHQVYSEMLRLNPTQPTSLVFHDFEGHEIELMVTDSTDAPQMADADDIPSEYRIRGIEGARSYATADDLLPFAEHLGFRADGDRLILEGETRGARWYFSPVPDRSFEPLAPGVWHHMALDAGDELGAWRDHAHAGPTPFTQVFDHYFFDSAYSVSPGGLVELCSAGPGFTLDQTLEELGEGAVSLSPWTEPLREKLERDLTPSSTLAAGAGVPPRLTRWSPTPRLPRAPSERDPRAPPSSRSPWRKPTAELHRRPPAVEITASQAASGSASRRYADVGVVREHPVDPQREEQLELLEGVAVGGGVGAEAKLQR